MLMVREMEAADEAMQDLRIGDEQEDQQVI